MKRITIIFLFFQFAFSVSINSNSIDLKKIHHIAPKGRIQDKQYNPNLKIIHDLIDLGKDSIPLLIYMLEDETKLKNGIVDFWREIYIGDLAHIILSDFFTDSGFKESTVPEADRNILLEISKIRNKKIRREYIQGEQDLRDFIRIRGRTCLKNKWIKIWEKYKTELYWDKKSLCFRVKI